MSGNKAIETNYKGYRFRSRLEARWAIFLDAMGATWHYELQGYELDGERYLPDFWIKHIHDVKPHPNGLPPEQGFWVEIKPTPPTNAELDLCHKLALLTQHCVYLLAGSVGCQEYTCHKFHFRGNYVISGPIGHDKPAPWWCDNHFEHYLTCCCGKEDDPIGTYHELPAAYQAARSARFEHGENPGW
jgi:hypothetical protein